ncbi:hypothetical protein LNV23_21815 [Paucibacter sp. DJ1R-11]|uniref:hypothetical protein n=1 Tax=Paucibacter sp. DJ1R-11 TaxID=2893556 RepID=UPI0021E3D90D|nr:hypothetical protein [Paucibacter sp. DJ1R-11]MCV2366085.1 hypothetical protein [Paucibacter sp. DJ1R-11]
MNFIKKTVAVLAAAASFSAFAENRLGIFSVLPTGLSTASILGIATDPKVEKISRIFTAAAQANNEWFKGYVAAHSNLKPGDILPYHKNFGISEDEYRFFIESIQKSARIIEVGKI